MSISTIHIASVLGNLSSHLSLSLPPPYSSNAGFALRGSSLYLESTSPNSFPNGHPYLKRVHSPRYLLSGFRLRDVIYRVSLSITGFGDHFSVDLHDNEQSTANISIFSSSSQF